MDERMKIEHWFPTFTSKIINLENPTPDMVDIEDIAHALSMTCRFGGHCRDFYSVAEHSVNVQILGSLLPQLYNENQRRALALLLHDSAEAYLGDVVSPLKRMLRPQYQELEKRWLRAIEIKFNLGNLLTEPEPLVKHCDLRALSIEIENLCSPVHPDWWTKFEKPTLAALHDLDIQCLSPAQARRKFLTYFKQLSNC
jgi:hypothetical protein